MTFLQPAVLILLLLLPVMLAFFIWRAYRRRVLLRHIGDPDLVADLSRSISPLRRRWKLALWLIALGAVIIALARPAWGIDEDFVEVRGISIIVVLDVSTSMDAQDVQPSRLERAKLSARRLFEAAEGNQIGLVLFAGNAFVQFPLTTDTDSAVTFLNAASTDSITRQGTALEDALLLAIESFDERIASESVIVLLTDGENHQGEPLAAAELAAEQGITIHAVGYGSEDGEPIPVLDDDGQLIEYKADRAGDLVLSRLDGETLQRITEMADGIYRQATPSGIEIVDLLNQINQLEQSILETRRQIRRVERFELFVMLALLALSVEILLPEVRRETIA